jgi:Fe-S oxidoreductase
LDDIFDLIGVERVKREYDRENCLCCGSSIRTLLRKDDLADEVQKKNVDDMVESGAEACIFNCPMCYDTLKEKVEGEAIYADWRWVRDRIRNEIK